MTEKYPYCQKELNEINKSTGRTQHSHRCKTRSGFKCRSCGYKRYSETQVMDRGGKIKQISSSQSYERIPSKSVAVIRGDDKFIQNSTRVKSDSELQEEIERADDYRESEGYDTFYFIVRDKKSKEIKVDENYYDGDDLEEDATYRISDDGLEKLE